jgi:Asp-tRNA(Asn)/Glu-tRNA(Gln) amidotransferase B subunit
MATTSRKSEEGSSTCPNCDTKMRRLASENAKLRSKLQEVTGRRDHYAKLYYEALAELETYKRKIEWIVKDLAEELVPAGGKSLSHLQTSDSIFIHR